MNIHNEGWEHSEKRAGLLVLSGFFGKFKKKLKFEYGKTCNMDRF